MTLKTILQYFILGEDSKSTSRVQDILRDRRNLMTPQPQVLVGRAFSRNSKKSCGDGEVPTQIQLNNTLGTYESRLKFAIARGEHALLPLGLSIRNKTLLKKIIGPPLTISAPTQRPQTRVPMKRFPVWDFGGFSGTQRDALCGAGASIR